MDEKRAWPAQQSAIETNQILVPGGSDRNSFFVCMNDLSE